VKLANALKSLQNKMVKTKEEKMKFKQEKQKNLANTADKHEKKLIKKIAKNNRNEVQHDGGDFLRPTNYSKIQISNSEFNK
jgi:hypothetical protein